MKIYYPDRIEPNGMGFDFGAMLSTIGSGIVSVGSKILTSQNIATVVSGIVAQQVAKSTAPKTVSAPVPQTMYVTQPGAAAVPMPYPSVSTQPVIISGGGGGAPISAASMLPASPFAGFSLSSIHPAYLILGALGLGYLIFERGK
jgi:hypothetical protein